MRELILVRHAKSSWDDLRLSDHDRPLNERGRSDAPYVASWAASHVPPPGLMIVSTARRAQETADAFIAAYGLSSTAVEHTRDVYHATVESLLEVIAWVPDPAVERVMVVGHNPTMTMMLDHLTDQRIDNMPTCSMALIRFPQAESWKDLRDGDLVLFVTPKGLRAGDERS